ncbi:hypothetical protein Tco_1091881 [Tanacetum coccineum]|uniref:Uncharacterized protein n=1 Tax=Tanacetum coccineum TaxID=301880 RepID=A0ABQ5I8B8_9ASTR
MDLETAQTNTTAKLPLLKQGEYEMWKLRIEQYFQVQDYAIWDVIENGNSFKPVARTTTNANGTSTSLIPGPVTADEKTQNKNDVKARSMLLMALPNEHLLTFNQYKDAKTLLQKIVSQLAILGEIISQEDLNLKYLRSLPSEWNTHVVVWRNKHDQDTMSFDDLYNNFNIVEQEVKGTANSSSSSSSQNMAFMSSPNSTNEVNTAYEVKTANNQSYMEDDEVPTNMALMGFSDSEIPDKSRKGLGFVSYNVVPPPHTWLFAPPTLDLSNSGLEEFQQPEFEGYGPKISKSVSENVSNEVRKSPDAPLVEELVLDIDKPKAVNTARPNTTVVNVVRANQVNAIKALTYWVWRPTKLNRPSTTCPISQTSKNLMEHMLPLGEELKEEELLVNELLKLVLVKVPGKNNIYNVDMNNIVPKESLTCLVAKATLDESML